VNSNLNRARGTRAQKTWSARLPWNLSHDPSVEPAPPPAPLGGLTAVFLRIGNTTFGGGFITMIMLGRELVERRQWLKQGDYDLAFSLARVTPGTNIIAFCAAVGSLLRGWWGAILAVFAVTVPSAAIAVALMQGFESWRDRPWVMAGLAATEAAVTGMMWSTVWLLIRPFMGKLKGDWSRKAFAVAVTIGACVAGLLGATPVPVIVVATLIGFLWPEERA
jgi:chromate transporter